MARPRKARTRLPFRRRLALVAAAAVAIAVVLSSAITFAAVRGELRGQIDDSLRRTARDLARDRVLFFRPATKEGVRKQARVGIASFEVSASDERGIARITAAEKRALMRAARDAVSKKKGLTKVVPAPGAEERLALPAPPEGGDLRYAQVVRSSGDVIRSPQFRFALGGRDRATRLAQRGTGAYFSDAEVNGTHMRVYTRALGRGAAVQIARPVEETDSFLRRLMAVLAAVSLGGVAVAGGLAVVVVRAGLKPVADLSTAARHVARTRDLSRRIESGSADELGELADSFNVMLEALERSVLQQRQLVTDASHELRTPLTSLRLNIHLITQNGRLPAAERQRLQGKVAAQVEELTMLVGDLMDLAREAEEEQKFAEDLRLDYLVAGVVDRARIRHPEREFRLDATPTVIRGLAPRLERAVANLLDNAEKWSPTGGIVEVSVAEGEVVVTDHGPGIADEDLPFVFDRFYRAPSARALPGSGLGLAIVRQVAETHGGEVRVERVEGAGARLRLRLREV